MHYDCLNSDIPVHIIDEEDIRPVITDPDITDTGGGDYIPPYPTGGRTLEDALNPAVYSREDVAMNTLKSVMLIGIAVAGGVTLWNMFQAHS
jgi:hypothetical protein